ncbi:MAG: hypothetical protein M0R28_11915 [Pigmentiphaga sp.]|nr:hypothetical protein [Pigmentiphaga sp.]
MRSERDRQPQPQPNAASGRVELIDVDRGDGTQVVLALGMQWHTVLGRDLTRQARRRARSRRASHWVHAGGRAESVGTCHHLGKRVAGRSRVAYAAAQAFARLVPEGYHVAMLGLPGAPGRVWIARVRDGRVVEGGEWLSEDSTALAQAWRELSAQVSTVPVLWGGVDDGPGLDGRPPRALEWRDLADAVGPDSLLQPLRPTGLWVAAGLGLASALVVGGRLLPSIVEPQAPHLAAETVAVEPSMDELWRQAYETWRTGARWVAPAGLDAVAHALLQVPLAPAGWRLRDVRCDWRDVAWRCRAAYQRGHRLARQAGLMSAVPAGWNVSWLGLDQAEGRWDLPAAGRLPEWPDLAWRGDRWIPDADRLLGMSGAWQSIDVGRRQPISIGPATAPGNAPTPPPRDLSPLALRELTLLGPLRSLGLLPADMTRRIAWQSVELRYLPDQPPALDRSALMMTLRGLAHESLPENPDV